MKLRSIAFALTFVSLPGLMWAANPPSASFSVEQSTMAPGTILQPGTYSIRIVDHLQDRLLVSVEGTTGTSRAMFIAVPSKSLAGQTGAVLWTTAPDNKAALRGFIFKNGNTPLEFVYPKDEAVSLAKANGTGVLAVDPASEGKPPELARLSNSDMQMVTLWMLTPERVSAQASEVSISASKYQDKSEPGPNQQIASLNKRPPVLNRLPHTASLLPLILIAGILAFVSAAILKFRRSVGVTS